MQAFLPVLLFKSAGPAGSSCVTDRNVCITSLSLLTITRRRRATGVTPRQARGGGAATALLVRRPQVSTRCRFCLGSLVGGAGLCRWRP